MKIFIIGWFGAGNIGDEAILISELLFLREKISGVEFYILSFNPDRTRKLTAKIPEVKKILRMGSKQHVIKSDFFGILKAFREVNTVIIGGGGIFQDIYNYYPIPFFTAMVLFARLNRKQSLLFCVGIGPVNTFIGKKLCRVAATFADVISVRDSESRELLNELGVSKKIYLSADPVFLLEPVRNEKVDKIIKAKNLDRKGPIVMICVQDLMSWSNKNRQILAEILDTLTSDKGAKVIFLPLGAYRDSWFGCRSSATVDMAASKKIVALMRMETSILTDEMTPQELLSVMKKVDLVISMRLHGLIMGLTLGIPVIALTYEVESKIKNLMKRLDQESSLFDVNNLEKGKISNRIDYLLSNMAEVKRQLAKIVSAVRVEAEKCNDMLIKEITCSTSIKHYRERFPITD